MMEDDDLLIDTPWGKKRWGLVRKGLMQMNRIERRREELHAMRVEAAKKATETKRKNKLLKEQQNENTNGKEFTTSTTYA
jgi:predicted GIY-YIG superfamily endonuclease